MRRHGNMEMRLREVQILPPASLNFNNSGVKKTRFYSGRKQKREIILYNVKQKKVSFFLLTYSYKYGIL